MKLSLLRSKVVASPYLLLGPLLLFVAFFFVAPIASMLLRSVHSTEVLRGLPETAEALRGWEMQGLPEDEAFAALHRDLVHPERRSLRAEAGRRLNYELPGLRELIILTARKLRRMEPPASASNAKALLVAVDERWRDSRIWSILKRASSPYTSHFLLAAVDLTRSPQGEIVPVEEGRRIFVDILVRTMTVSFFVTLICLLVGYPFANFMVRSSGAIRLLSLVAILLPFWTSLLVRTSSWIVVLQREGVVNSLLDRLGLVQEPPQLVFNRLGVYIVMVHILIPFMVLPIYSNMKNVSDIYTKAAASLGANPLQSFLRVYLPLTLPGVVSGCIVTFVVCIGYYITPALVGGPNDQMIGYFIAFYTNTELNWGMASALALILLGIVLLLYYALSRTVGLGSLMGGSR